MGFLFRFPVFAIYIALAFSLATAVSANDGKIYKWVDENGKVHFSDRQSEKEGKSQEVELKEAQVLDTSEEREYQRYLKKQRREQYKKDRIEDAKDQQYDAKLEEYCANLAKTLHDTRRATHLYRWNKTTKKREYYTVEEQDQYMKELKARYEEYCS